MAKIAPSDQKFKLETGDVLSDWFIYHEWHLPYDLVSISLKA